MTLETTTYAVLFYASLAGLSAAIVWRMTHVGVLDVPNARSSHSQATPKGGGLGIAIAFFVGIAGLYTLTSSNSVASPSMPTVVVAAAFVAAAGFLDDLFGWPAWRKLSFQIIAAAIIVLADFEPLSIHVAFTSTLMVSSISRLLIFIWIIFMMNAVNFMDGLNGLAAGVVGIACLGVCLLGTSAFATYEKSIALVLLSGIVGFLPFNFPKAKVFMGDIGSQLCGFLVAIFPLSPRIGGVVLLPVLFVQMILAGLLFDVGLTLVRRALAGERLTQAHRSHLYQLAYQSGVPATAVTVIHWGFAAWGVVCCAIVLHVAADWRVVFIVAVLPPQLAWWLYVDYRAIRAAIPRPMLRFRPPPV